MSIWKLAVQTMEDKKTDILQLQKPLQVDERCPKVDELQGKRNIFF